MSYTQALWHETVRLDNNLEAFRGITSLGERLAKFGFAQRECKLLAHLARSGGDHDLTDTFVKIERRCVKAIDKAHRDLEKLTR